MVLKTGSRGTKVADVQKRLMDLHYAIDQVDGKYGTATQEAVQFFQHYNGMEANGELTEEQMALLFSADAQRAIPIADPSAPIGGVEMKQMITSIQAAIAAPDEQAEHRILAPTVMKFGLRLLKIIAYFSKNATGDMKVAAEAFKERATGLFVDWLAGDALTDRADEDELRALAATDVLRAGGPGFIRIATESILRLPTDHPLRDVESLKTNLKIRAQECREQGEWEDFVWIGDTMLFNNILEDPEAQTLADEMVALADNPVDGPIDLDDETRRKVYVAVARWYIDQFFGHRDEGQDTVSDYLAASLRYMQKAQEIRRSPKDALIVAVALDEEGQTEEAADLLSPLVDSGEGGWDTAAWMEGLYRLVIGHYRRSVEVLERIVAMEEEKYLLAMGDENVNSSGERYSKDAVNLAFGYAFLGRWAEAIHTIDRAKNPRFRHAKKLRQSSAGTKLLKLEARLTSARRGVPDPDVAAANKHLDPLGSRVSAAARALESYRKARPDLATTQFTLPTLSEIGAALEKDEAVVCMGSSFKGLMMGVVLRGDTDSPSGKLLLEELPKKDVVKLMFDGDEPAGWALELAAFEPVDPEPALEMFLNKADHAFGEMLADFLHEHGVRKVTIIPHLFLHFVPFWALPSMRGLDVRVSRSMAQWLQARKRVATLNTNATSIGNPTLDLGLAAAEAESLKTVLAKRGCQTDVLVESAAREGAIRESVRKSGILHFAGHGMARHSQPLLSALLTHPDKKWNWPAGGDPLAGLVKVNQEWVEASDGTRYSDVAEGRLIMYLDEQGEMFELCLEHTQTGTLWGRYDQNQLLQLAELWTVSDILIEDVFANCSLAFLGACDSGRAAFQTDVDEDVGLPSALQLAGVDSVVCTMWPVGDVDALIFSGIFYHQLTAQPKGTLDLATLVAASRAALANIHRDDVVAMLHEIAEQLTGKVTRAELDYVVEKMSSGPERPFAHPYHWAAFFTQGSECVEIPWD